MSGLAGNGDAHRDLDGNVHIAALTESNRQAQSIRGYIDANLCADRDADVVTNGNAAPIVVSQLHELADFRAGFDGGASEEAHDGAFLTRRGGHGRVCRLLFREGAARS